jgi:hypothetical protein
MLLALEVPFMRQVILASSLLSLVASGLLTGCPDRSISGVLPEQGRVEFNDIPVNVNRDVDILFVIDDSPSMADKQKNLATNFPRFIDVLSTIQGGLPNVHIAVVTSDLGSKGAEDTTPGPGIGSIGSGGCSGLGKAGNMQLFGAAVSGGPYISDILQPDNVTRVRNYTYVDKTSLPTVFSQMAKAGAGGCGFEQHLEAMKQALSTSNVVNQGFLRENAYLAIIIIADEDDCSMAHSSLIASTESGPLGPLQSFRCTRFGVLCNTGGSTTDQMNQVGTKSQCHPNNDSAYLTKVVEYADFLKKTVKKADPNKVIVAGIMGTTEPFATELRAPPKSTTMVPALAHSCSYNGATGLEVADPPTRIKAFLDQFPNRNTFASICQQDLSGGLQQIADLLKTALGDPCIKGRLADVDSKTPGAQYECSVETSTPNATGGTDEALLPQCTDPAGAGATKPCWYIAEDPVCPAQDPTSATSAHLTFKFALKDSLPKDTHIIANCVTEVTNK